MAVVDWWMVHRLRFVGGRLLGGASPRTMVVGPIARIFVSPNPPGPSPEPAAPDSQPSSSATGATRRALPQHVRQSRRLGTDEEAIAAHECARLPGLGVSHGGWSNEHMTTLRARMSGARMGRPWRWGAGGGRMGGRLQRAATHENTQAMAAALSAQPAQASRSRWTRPPCGVGRSCCRAEAFGTSQHHRRHRPTGPPWLAQAASWAPCTSGGRRRRRRTRPARRTPACPPLGLARRIQATSPTRTWKMCGLAFAAQQRMSPGGARAACGRRARGPPKRRAALDQRPSGSRRARNRDLGNRGQRGAC